MPSASDELRARMDDLFGDPIDEAGPVRYLMDRGYTERGGMIVKPSPDHEVTPTEWDCIGFLCDEWDFAFDPSITAPIARTE